MVSASPRIRINFNPRPREEGDAAGVALYGTKWISIHALVKRATLAEYKFSLKAVISIHALVKRATLINFDKNASDTISIHALVKRATIDKTRDKLGEMISIHALVKRATFCCRHHRLYL